MSASCLNFPRKQPRYRDITQSYPPKNSPPKHNQHNDNFKNHWNFISLRLWSNRRSGWRPGCITNPGFVLTKITLFVWFAGGVNGHISSQKASHFLENTTTTHSIDRRSKSFSPTVYPAISPASHRTVPAARHSHIHPACGQRQCFRARRRRRECQAPAETIRPRCQR